MLVQTGIPLTAEIDALGGGPVVVEIPGKPAAKGRVRFTRSGHPYTPDSTTNAETWAKLCMVQQAGLVRLTGALRLEVTATREVPASWSKRKRAAALAGIIRPTSKPDSDNLLKLYGDAGNGVLWADDAQITTATVRKRYGEAAGVLLTVSQEGGSE